MTTDNTPKPTDSQVMSAEEITEKWFPKRFYGTLIPETANNLANDFASQYQSIISDRDAEIARLKETLKASEEKYNELDSENAKQFHELFHLRMVKINSKETILLCEERLTSERERSSKLVEAINDLLEYHVLAIENNGGRPIIKKLKGLIFRTEGEV